MTKNFENNKMEKLCIWIEKFNKIRKWWRLWTFYRDVMTMNGGPKMAEMVEKVAT